jgi:hypothetical protein
MSAERTAILILRHQTTNEAKDQRTLSIPVGEAELLRIAPPVAWSRWGNVAVEAQRGLAPSSEQREHE